MKPKNVVLLGTTGSIGTSPQQVAGTDYGLASARVSLMLVAMSEPAAKQPRRYTWTDYQSWNDDQRWEIIDGEAFLMASPTSRHQIIVGELHAQMHRYFKGQPCRLFVAPMDVVLSEEDVVQPDLLVVCQSSQIKRTHIEGPPTLCVEVVSADSGLRDRMRKLGLYARSGVTEYWLVTPWPAMVDVLRLDGQSYRVHQVFTKQDQLTSPTFPGLQIALRDVFDFPLEPGEEPPAVKEPPAPKYRAPAPVTSSA
ncbi:MAG: Uma2 family endonuclease [Acidobacteria bacterium]|nr:Uma2 family endonuclease [Acidobacteriota bacterium]